MHTLIAVPSHDMMHADFVQSLTALVQNTGADVKLHSGTLVHLAREALAKYALEERYDWIMWLDADMVFDPDIIDRLKAHGKQFVTGLYYTRRPPHVPTIYEQAYPTSAIHDIPDRLFRIGACGFGAVLLHTDILRAMRDHWGTWFNPKASMGEDIAFCWRAGEMGIELWCDPAVRLGHIKTEVVWPK